MFATTDFEEAQIFLLAHIYHWIFQDSFRTEQKLKLYHAVMHIDKIVAAQYTENVSFSKNLYEVILLW